MLGGGDVCCEWKGNKACLTRAYASDGGAICPKGMWNENTKTVDSCPNPPFNMQFKDKSNYNNPALIGGTPLQDYFYNIKYPGAEGCYWTVPDGGKCVNSHNCRGSSVCCENFPEISKDRTCQPARTEFLPDTGGNLCPCVFARQYGENGDVDFRKGCPIRVWLGGIQVDPSCVVYRGGTDEQCLVKNNIA